MQTVKALTLAALTEGMNAVSRSMENLMNVIQGIPETEFDRQTAVPVVEVLNRLSAVSQTALEAEVDIKNMLIEYKKIRTFLIDLTDIHTRIRDYLIGCEVDTWIATRLSDDCVETLLLSYSSTGVAAFNRTIVHDDLPNGDEVVQLPSEFTRAIGLICTSLLSTIPDGVWEWTKILSAPGYQVRVTVAEVVDNGEGTIKRMVAIHDAGRNQRTDDPCG